MANRIIEQAKSVIKPPDDPAGEQAAENVRRLIESARADEATGTALALDGATPRNAVALAGLVEREEWGRAYIADASVVGRLVQLSADANAQLGERRLVDPDLIRRLQGELAQWAAARGLNGQAGGGSA
jgi:hypothetical protein